jgi:hypothetical protein
MLPTPAILHQQRLHRRRPPGGEAGKSDGAEFFAQWF